MSIGVGSCGSASSPRLSTGAGIRGRSGSPPSSSTVSCSHHQPIRHGNRLTAATRDDVFHMHARKFSYSRPPLTRAQHSAGRFALICRRMAETDSFAMSFNRNCNQREKEPYFHGDWHPIRWKHSNSRPPNLSTISSCTTVRALIRSSTVNR